MDSRSSSGGDRLSRLGDAALGHILSFLPAAEAARTASLSRRWRHVFAAVHTLSFRETEGPFRMGSRWWQRCNYCDDGEMPAPRLVAGVSAALHGRHRGFAATTPLRALRVVFDESGFRGGHDATTAIDGWLSYALHAGAASDELLEIDLRLSTESICDRTYTLLDLDATAADGNNNTKIGEQQQQQQQDAEDEEEPSPEEEKYVVPRSLFSSSSSGSSAASAALRALRLSGCWINLPLSAAFTMPSLDTLDLTRVTGRRGAIQRLVSACPSLFDLTLEACCGKNLTELSLDGARLRRLVIRCCHSLTTVNAGSPELRAFEYRGAIPPATFLTMAAMRAACTRSNKFSFCALDFCGAEVVAPQVFGLLELFAGVERLHLTSARLATSFVSHGNSEEFPCFPKLRHLEITGMLPDDDASAAILTTVARMLEGTPRLETLSLFFLPEPPHPATAKQPLLQGRLVDKEVLRAVHELRYDPHARLAVPPHNVEIPASLRETTREINLVHYKGSAAQRALAKFLLCNAPVVEEVYWKVARGPLYIQRKLMEEIKGWVVNKSATMMFF